MTDHSINKHMVSSSLALHCYSMLMLMTLWWPFALIQMTSSDILGLGSRQEAVGMLWQTLSLASSSADGLSWTCCVISQPSYRNQTWLNTFCLQQIVPPQTQLHLSFCYDFWDLVLNLDLIRPRCLWENSVMHLPVLFVLLLITYLHFFDNATLYVQCVHCEQVSINDLPHFRWDF